RRSSADRRRRAPVPQRRVLRPRQWHGEGGFGLGCAVRCPSRYRIPLATRDSLASVAGKHIVSCSPPQQEVTMSRTQVKLLQNVVSVSPGLNLTSELTVEKDINAFLASNEGKIRLIDIKLSSNAASV